MNFEVIRKIMDEEAKTIAVPHIIPDITQSTMPIQVIRRRMAFEVKLLLIASVVSLFIPLITTIDPIPKNIYLVAVIMSVFINVRCMTRMNSFLKKTDALTDNTLEVVKTYIQELHFILTFYRYSTFISSLFLVIAVVCLYIRTTPKSDILQTWLTFNLETSKMLIILASIVSIPVVVYFFVKLNIKFVYGKEEEKLKEIIKSLEA